MALRFDRTSLQSPRIDHNGYLQAVGVATRVGVFPYRHPDGSVSRELRHPDDVFKADSLTSLSKRPIVDEHPAGGRVDSNNTRHLAVGFAGEKVDHDDRLVTVPITIHDQAAIDKVMRGDRPKRELSCGYSATVVPEEGVYQGEKYDHRQTEITYNHIALVWKGRAGPEARLHLDDADAVAEDLEPGAPQRSDAVEENEGTILVSIRPQTSFIPESIGTAEVPGVDGVTRLFGQLSNPGNAEPSYPVTMGYRFLKDAGWTAEKARKWAEGRTDADDAPNPQHREDAMTVKIKLNAIQTKALKLDAAEITVPEDQEPTVKLLEDRLDAAVAALREQENKNDELTGQMDGLKAQANPSLETIQKLSREHADACGVAHAVGLKDYERLDTAQIKRAVVGHVAPEIKLDDVSEGYVDGRYAAVVDKIRADHKGLQSLAELRKITSPDPDPATRKDMEEQPSPRERFIADTQNMHRLTPEQRAEKGFS